MTLLEKQLNRDFDKWKQCGNTIVGLRVADKVAKTVNVYALEITHYNKDYAPLATNKNPKVFKNVALKTWADVENLVFGKPQAPQFTKTLAS